MLRHSFLLFFAPCAAVSLCASCASCARGCFIPCLGHAHRLLFPVGVLVAFALLPQCFSNRCCPCPHHPCFASVASHFSLFLLCCPRFSLGCWHRASRAHTLLHACLFALRVSAGHLEMQLGLLLPSSVSSSSSSSSSSAGCVPPSMFASHLIWLRPPCLSPGPL